MKRSIKTIAAFYAAVTMTFSCIPVTFAAEDIPAVQTEAEEAKTGFEFSEGNTVETPYKGTAEIADENGIVYYSGYDRANRRQVFYTLDENGEMKHSYAVESYVNDKGEKTDAADSEIKQCGEDIYILYSEVCGSTVKENIVVRLDKELREIARYNVPKCDCFDTNGEKIVYVKSRRNIYSMDMDGKNKKKLFTLGQDNDLNNMNFLAVSGDHIGFKGIGSDPSSPRNSKEYCCFIDIKTGELTMKEQRSVQQLYSSNGRIVWYSPEWRDIRDSYNSEGEYSDTYFKKSTEYFKDGEAYILDSGEYRILKTQSPSEPADLTIDSAGNVITHSYKNGRHIFKFYRDGKLTDTYSANLKGYCGFTANNGVLTISYTGRDAAASDWVSYDPQTSTPEEIQSQLDKTPASKDTVRSVTVYYKKR